MKYKSIHSSKAVIALAAKLIHLRRHAITKDSKKAINIINQYIKLWPGGKQKSDTFINSLGEVCPPMYWIPFITAVIIPPTN